MSRYERRDWVLEYYDMGGASAFELRVVELVNEARIRNGLNELTIEPALMHAARFYSQTMANHDLPLSHYAGPYGSAREVARAFNVNLGRWSGGNGNMGSWSAQVIVNAWMNSPSHRAFMMAEDHRYIGFGSQLGGRMGVVHYLFLSANPAGA